MFPDFTMASTSNSTRAPQTAAREAPPDVATMTGRTGFWFSVQSSTQFTNICSSVFRLAGQSDGSRCRLSSKEASERATAIKNALREDALGPLLAGALFGDVPRALLEIPVFAVRWVSEKLGVGEMNSRGGDRAEALERAFEQNWAHELGRTKLPNGASQPTRSSNLSCHCSMGRPGRSAPVFPCGSPTERTCHHCAMLTKLAYLGGTIMFSCGVSWAPTGPPA